MSGPVPPYTEVPVYIEFAQRGDHYNYDQSNTSVVERRPLYTNEVWLDAASIPVVPPTPLAAFPGGPQIGFVRGVEPTPLSQVVGNPFQFKATTPGTFVNMVPGNFSEGAYKPTLTDAAGEVIPYNPSVWVADGVRQLIEFKYKTPAELGFTLPLAISYWHYVGAFPGPGGGLSAVDNVGLPGGDVWESTTASTAHLRRLIPDPLAANAGIAIANAAQNITVGNTMTGVNLGPASNANVFSAKNGANLEFRRLTAGANMIVTQNANDIVLAAIPDGGVTSGNNLGIGAEVFKDVAPPTQMNFRTLIAGPTTGLGITQDLPVADEIQITADEVDAVGIDLVPAALDLFVNAAIGNDVTGTGSAGSPFQTLDRAFRTVRVVGYDDTATITVQAAGGMLVLPTGVQSTNKGTRGRRRDPPTILGQRTLAAGAVAITIVTQDATTGFYDLTVAPGPVFTPGQIVSITAGAAIGVETFIAEVVSPTVIRIPYSGSAPVPGDTFDLWNLATMLQYANTAFVGAGGGLTLRDLRLVSTAAAGTALSFMQQDVQLTGVWIQNNSDLGFLTHEGGSLRCGGDTVFAFGPAFTNLGAYLSNTTAAKDYAVFGLSSSRFTGLVCHGNSEDANFLLGVAPDAVQSSYFARIGSLEILGGVSTVRQVWFDDCFPVPPAGFAAPGGALEVRANAAVDAAGLKVDASSQCGVRIAEGGVLTLGPTVSLASCGNASFLAESGGQLTCNAAPTVTLSTGPAYLLTDQARLISHVAIAVNGAASNGIALSNSSTMQAPSISTTGNNGTGLFVTDGSSVVVEGDVQAANNNTGVFLDASATLQAVSVLASANISTGVLVMQNSTLSAELDVVASNNSAGMVVQWASVVIGRSLTATDNTGTNVSLASSRAVFGTAAGAVDVGDSTVGSGLQALQSSIEARVATFDSNSNGATGIVLTDSTLKIICPAVSASDNGAFGLALARATFVATGDGVASTTTTSDNAQGGIASNDATVPTDQNRSVVDVDTLACLDNGGIGVDLGGTHLYARGTVSVNSVNPATTGGIVVAAASHVRCENLGADLIAIAVPLGAVAILVAEGSTLTVADEIVALGNTIGLNAETVIAVTSGSRVYAGMATVICLAGALTAVGVLVSNAELRLGDALSAVGATAGTGLHATTAALVAVDNALTATGNGTNVLAESGSKVAGSVITATGATSGDAIFITDSAVSAMGSINAGGGAGGGMSALRSTVAVGGDLSATLCGDYGIFLASSIMRVGGSVDASVNGLEGIVANNQSTLQVTTTLTASNNSSDGISLTAADLTVGGDLVVDNNGSVGLVSVFSRVRVLLNAFMTGNLFGLILAGEGALAVNAAVLLDGLGSPGTGVTVQNNARLVSSSLAVNNYGSGILAQKGTFVQDFISIGPGSVTGISLQQNSLMVGMSTITSSASGAGQNLVMLDSTLVGNFVTLNGSTGNRGLQATNSSIRITGTLTASTNNQTNISLINSVLRVLTTLTASGSTAGRGIDMTSSEIEVNGSLVANNNAQENIVLTEAVLTTSGDVSASTPGATFNGLDATGSTIRIGGTLTASSSATGVGVSAQSSDITVVGAATTNGNNGCIMLTMSRMRVQGILTANNAGAVSTIMLFDASTLAVGADTSINGGGTSAVGLLIQNASSMLTLGNLSVAACAVGINMHRGVLTAGGITASGMTGIGVFMDAASNLATAGGVIANTNGGANLSIANSTLFCGIASFNGSVGSVGILATNSTLTIETTLAASNNSQTNIALTNSTLKAAGAITASSSATSNGLLLVNSDVVSNGALTASTNNLANINATRSRITATVCTASSSTAGQGIVAVSSSFVFTGGVTNTFSTNQLTNLELTTSSFVTPLNVSALGSVVGNGVSLTASQFTISGALTATGNAATSFNATSGSSVFVGGGMTVHNIGATTCVNLSSSRVVAAGGCTFATAASTGVKLRMRRSEFITDSTIAATTATAGNGVEISERSTLVVGTLLLTGNATNLLATDSAVVVSTLTGTNPSGANNVQIMDESSLEVGVLTISNSGAASSNGLRVENGSRAVVTLATVSGNYTAPVRIRNAAEFIITGTLGGSTLTGTGATNILILDNCRFYMLNVAVTGAGSHGVLVTNTAAGVATTISSGSNGGSGILVSTGGKLELPGPVTGTLNTGQGVTVATRGTVIFTSAFLPTITGTGGNCKVGVNAATTWANIDTGQLQYTNDWMFPAGASPPLITSVSQLCCCIPS